MDPAELEEFKHHLAALRESEIPPATERQMLEAFQRRWPAGPADSRELVPQRDDPHQEEYRPA